MTGERDALIVGDHEIEYGIRRSRLRQTLCIQVHPGGEVRLLAPQRAPLPLIRDFLAARADWVVQKRAEQAGRAGQRFQPLEGAGLPWLDETLRLRRLGESERPRCRRVADELQVTANDDREAVRAIERWYRRSANDHLPARLEALAARLDCYPAAVTIRGQRSRWGSCSASGAISLNWRLMLLPTAIVDYVLVHELCHLQHHDHSPRFWALVARHLPDYRQHRKRLREIARDLPSFR
jgi:hypothetical protein